MWLQAPFPLLPSQGWRRVVSICWVAALHAWLPGIVRGRIREERGAVFNHSEGSLGGRGTGRSGPASPCLRSRGLSRSGGWGTTVSGDPDSHQGRWRRGTPGFRIKDLAENNCFLPNTQN